MMSTLLIRRCFIFMHLYMCLFSCYESHHIYWFKLNDFSTVTVTRFECVSIHNYYKLYTVYSIIIYEHFSSSLLKVVLFKYDIDSDVDV